MKLVVAAILSLCCVLLFAATIGLVLKPAEPKERAPYSSPLPPKHASDYNLDRSIPRAEAFQKLIKDAEDGSLKAGIQLETLYRDELTYNSLLGQAYIDRAGKASQALQQKEPSFSDYLFEQCQDSDDASALCPIRVCPVYMPPDPASLPHWYKTLPEMRTGLKQTDIRVEKESP